MSQTKQTIIVNGKIFDVRTGKPVGQSAHASTPQIPQRPETTPAAAKVAQPKRVISDFGVAAPRRKPSQPLQPRTAAPHRVAKPQKSTTLRRDILKKPPQAVKTSQPRQRRRVAQSPMVSRFNATQQEQATTPPKEVDHDLAREKAVIARAHQAHVKKQELTTKNVEPKEVKEHILKKQLEKAVPPTEESKRSFSLSRKQRFAGMIASGVLLLFVGGYLTYINIPNLSIRVAAANAGIDASLPRYQPDGFRINGPIAYTNGEVSVKYKQAGSSDVYTLTQRTSDWDPQATLDNYVEPESRDDYEIHSAQGLTVYTYGKKAVWVNGGILHVIEGNIPLSSQQIERIAASM